MVDRRVVLADLGAWLIKGNADRTDLAERLARRPTVESWCVQPNYRMHLMREPQPVVFWVSGSRARAGVWGIGRLTGPARWDPDTGHWRAPLDLVVWQPDRRIGRERLRADGRLAGLEVFRQPQGSNPSYLTTAQFTALQDHLS